MREAPVVFRDPYVTHLIGLGLQQRVEFVVQVPGRGLASVGTGELLQIVDHGLDPRHALQTRRDRLAKALELFGGADRFERRAHIEITHTHGIDIARMTAHRLHERLGLAKRFGEVLEARFDALQGILRPSGRCMQLVHDALYHLP